MRQKRWTKAGKKLKAEKPTLFSAGTGHNPLPKGGAHKRAVDYDRAKTRQAERKARQTGDEE